MAESIVRQEDAQNTYEELVRRHRGAFERLARRLTRNADDAEDLLQETLVDAYRGFHRFRVDTHFYSWVARIMTNNHLDRVRRKQHPTFSLDQTADEDAPALEVPDDAADPQQALLAEQLDQPFQTALDALQPLHRSTVVLCDLEGATYEEAATAEDCPVGTIRSRLHRAHNYLRNILASFNPSEEAVPAPRAHSRRAFLRMGTAAAMAGAAISHLSVPDEAEADSRPFRVLVWHGGDTEAAAAGLAEALQAGRGVEVRIAGPTAPGQGLSDAALRETDVLLFLGGEAQDRLHAERVAAVARRVRDEGMGFVAAQGAVESSLLQAVLGAECGFTGALRSDAEAVDVRITAPRHPIARGLTGFRVQQSRRFEGEWSGPKPEMVIFDTSAGSADQRAWQGMVWSAGRGRVFYFQPGHEAQPAHAQDEVRRIFRNAVQWAGHRAVA